MLTRRAALLGLLAAPALVRAGSLEYVPRGPRLIGRSVRWIADGRVVGYGETLTITESYGDLLAEILQDVPLSGLHLQCNLPRGPVTVGSVHAVIVPA